MPGSWLYIDTNFPVFTGEESTKDMMDTMLNYLHLMVEQLRYSLDNLSAANFNRKALGDLQRDTTKDLDEEVVELEAKAQELSESMSGLLASLSETQRSVDELQDRADALAESMELIGAWMQAVQAGLQVDEEGNVSLGVSGKDTALKGNVTVNGSPI